MDMQKDRPQKQWIESYGQHWKLKMKSCTPERKEKKNRKGKLNENTVNKAFRMGADSGTKPKDRESGQRKRKWK